MKYRTSIHWNFSLKTSTNTKLFPATSSYGSCYFSCSGSQGVFKKTPGWEYGKERLVVKDWGLGFGQVDEGGMKKRG